jgi:hypothetical protein
MLTFVSVCELSLPLPARDDHPTPLFEHTLFTSADPPTLSLAVFQLWSASFHMMSHYNIYGHPVHRLLTLEVALPPFTPTVRIAKWHAPLFGCRVCIVVLRNIEALDHSSVGRNPWCHKTPQETAQLTEEPSGSIPSKATVSVHILFTPATLFFSVLTQAA